MRISRVELLQLFFSFAELSTFIWFCDSIVIAILQEMLEEELPKCPTFYNLKKLTVSEGCMCCAFDAWYSLVKHCPDLAHSEEDREVIFIICSFKSVAIQILIIDVFPVDCNQ